MSELVGEVARAIMQKIAGPLDSEKYPPAGNWLVASKAALAVVAEWLGGNYEDEHGESAAAAIHQQLEEPPHA